MSSKCSFLLAVLLLCGLYVKPQSIQSDNAFSAGVSLYNEERFEEALLFFSLCDSLDKVEIDSASTRRVYSSMWLSSCYYKLGDTIRAAELSPRYYRFDPIDRRKTIVSDSLAGIADQFFLSGDDSLALVNLELCAQIERDSLGEYSIWLFNTITECGFCCFNMGDYEKAALYGEYAYAISDSIFDLNSDEYFESAYNLINYQGELGNYDAVRDILKHLEEIIDNDKGPELESDKYSGLLQYYLAIGDYYEVLRLFKKIFGDFQTVSDIVILNNIAACYSDLGYYQLAIEIENKILDLMQSNSSYSEEEYAIGLSNLAYYYSNIGDYPLACRINEKALLYYDKSNERNNPDYVLILSNLASCYDAIGNYKRAVEIAERVLGFRSEMNGENSIEYSTALNNLATYKTHLTNYDKDEVLAMQLQCVDILKNVVETHNQFYIYAICNLAVIYNETGDDEKSIRLLHQAEDLFKEDRQYEHIDLAQVYYNMANVYHDMNEYDSCLIHLQKSYDILAQNEMDKSPAFLQTAIGLYLSYFETKDIQMMKQWKDVVNNAIVSRVLYSLSGTTSFERENIWQMYSEWFYKDMPKCLLMEPSDEMVASVYNSVLLSKGLLLNTNIHIKNLLLNESDSLYSKYVELCQTKSYYNHIILHPDYYDGNIDSLRFSIECTERELLQESKVYKNLECQYNTDYNVIKQSLHNDQLAIEFITIPQDTLLVYYALCLKDYYEYPKLVGLFEISDLDTIEFYSLYNSSALYDLVWKPLENEIEGVKTIYFSPDGELHNLAIESALTPNGQRVSDCFDMRRLSSTREIATLNDNSNQKSIVLYGGLDYYANSDDLEAANKINDLQNKGLCLYAERSVVDDDRGGVGNLAGSKREVNSITHILPSSYSFRLFTDQMGTEESFKALSGNNYDIIHVSTHGYYWSESMSNRKSLGNRQIVNNDLMTEEDKALTRSGLYFAGVNTTLSGEEMPEDLDDGILTAHEISELDLRGTDLVVLSACQTGLGDLKGDGVFGLQRGFKKAGVRSILMSLWKVDDNATELLMVEFYRNYFSGVSKTQSLKNAQKYVREYSDTEGNKLYENPYYWAGFVLLD